MLVGKQLLAGLAVAISSACLAQTTSVDDSVTCPVQITGINPTGDDSFGHALTHNPGHARDSDGRMFVLKAKNTSGKDIRGMKFQAAYFDAIEDTTDVPTAWNWTDPLKAGSEKSFRWENSWREESKVGWRVRLLKVLYDDGSKWEAPSADACHSDWWRDKHHKS